MKTANQFQPDKNLSLLLIGPPGSGKTNVAMEFPDPWILDWGDSNLKNAVERHPGKTFFWDRVDQDMNGKEIAPELRWDRAGTLLKELVDKEGNVTPEVGTIVDDSLSMMQIALQDHIIKKGSQAEQPLVVGGVRVMSMSMWAAFSDLLRRRIIYAKSLGKPYVLICHEKVDESELSGSKYVRPLVSGSMGNSIAGLFSDYWACKVDTNAKKDQYKNGIRYYVRTVPDNRMPLKCSCNLPADFEFTWEAFLKETKK